MKNAGDHSKSSHARALCEKSAWAELLSLTKEWRTEIPADAKALFYQGIALAATGKLAEAEASYRHALRLDPGDFKAWNNLAALLFEKLNQPAAAVACLDQALKNDPKNPLGWANLASMNGQIGRHAQALACAERALTLDGEMVEAQLLRARAAQFLNKPEIIRAASEALAKLPPEKFQRAR